VFPSYVYGESAGRELGIDTVVAVAYTGRKAWGTWCLLRGRTSTARLLKLLQAVSGPQSQRNSESELSRSDPVKWYLAIQRMMNYIATSVTAAVSCQNAAGSRGLLVDCGRRDQGGASCCEGCRDGRVVQLAGNEHRGVG
jgi:hypothetical protein